MNRINIMRGNKILFHHNFITKVNYKVLNDTDLNNDITMYLYDNKKEINRLEKKSIWYMQTIQKKNLLKQWFTILKRINVYYKNFEEYIVKNIITKVENIVKNK